MTTTYDKYIELELKINIARRQAYFIISSRNGEINVYQKQRLEIINKYFTCYTCTRETKEHLLEMFEKCNEKIKETLGL